MDIILTSDQPEDEVVISSSKDINDNISIEFNKNVLKIEPVLLILKMGKIF